MIPVPVAPPTPEPRPEGRSGVITAWLGGLLLLGAFVGAVAWYLVIAPTSFVVFEATPGFARLEATGGETYVIAAEGIGVLDEERPPPITLTVRGIGGNPTDVEPYGEPGEPLGGPTYDVLGREGRALATFRPFEDGAYLISASPLGDASTATGYAPVPPPRYAVGREIGVTWWGGWTGLVVLAVLPLIVGAWLTIAAARTRRRNRATTVEPAAGPLELRRSAA